MVPMWFSKLIGTTSYRRAFAGRTAAWFRHGSDVAPRTDRCQVILKKPPLAERRCGCHSAEDYVALKMLLLANGRTGYCLAPPSSTYCYAAQDEGAQAENVD